ncbi:phospholipase D-like domain-containing protein [Flavobacterium anhuiense]|uniref:phospholipase D-like domain-containing protein n=1 Tax=Flavobacterium anhuiense TaxID=459526 RepID=UPI002026AAEE|nr:phospholipase D-like domain-containing protein [Flavobacterium anhuiense]URM36171.1 phospholipase D-like domain-containing protein [Flavobacterium anhuiense]
MRTSVITNNVLKARAIAGTYVVILAWDLIDPDAFDKNNLLGFAIERSEFQNDEIIEKYWMKGLKRFEKKDVGLSAGTPVSTAEHPFQSFQWSDYTAKENHQYRYRIVPCYGTPKLVNLDHANGLVIDVKTEKVKADDFDSNEITAHDIYFNRGVIGSQAYAREFGNRKPKVDLPYSKEMKWLSRGLFEALIDFISQAKDESFSLHAAFYEFHYQPVAAALAAVAESGAIVKIVFDAESSYKEENIKSLKLAGLYNSENAFPRTVSEGIRHNKFIVLSHNSKAIAVWTGSVNISAGGIFGHSNVGHVIRDHEVSKAYLEYWESLSENMSISALRKKNKKALKLPELPLKPGTLIPVFSPRDEKNENTTLEWYAKIMDSAKEIICFTIAFNLDETFQKVIEKDNDVLRYLVKDDDLGKNEMIGQDKDVIFASGSSFSESNWPGFLKELSDNPLNSNDYIHNKFMLVDPLGDNPIVITGSANFSKPSQRSNDENMLVIAGDTRVADIYLGEFMRIFDHHYVRYLKEKLDSQNKIQNSDNGFLKPDGSWTKSHFNPDSYKSKRRKYFIDSGSEVKNTVMKLNTSISVEFDLQEINLTALYVIVIGEHAGVWKILSRAFSAPPSQRPVEYTELKTIGVTSVLQDLGQIPILNATTGALGTGKLIRIK